MQKGRTTVPWHGWLVYADRVPRRQPGIYKITNLANGKALIGETQNIHDRFVRGYIVTNDYLRADLMQFGRSGFLVEPIRYYLPSIDRQIRLMAEAYYIGKLRTLVPDGYNVQSSSASGEPRGPLFGLAVSERMTEAWRDEEYRRMILASMEAVRPYTNQQLKAAWKRDREKRMQTMNSGEHRLKLRAGQLRRHEDPLEALKLSLAGERRWAVPGAREKQSAITKQYANTDQGIASRSRATKGTVFITNGHGNKRVPQDSILPKGFWRGRTNHGTLGRKPAKKEPADG